MRIRAHTAGFTHRLIKALVALAVLAGVLAVLPATATACEPDGSANINGDGDGGDVTGDNNCGGNETGNGNGGTEEFDPSDIVTCGDSGYEEFPDGTAISWQAAECDPVEEGIGSAETVDPIVVRDSAKASIRISDPVVASNPPFDDPGRFGVVGVPIWLWLDQPWEAIGPVSDTEGSVSVAVMAKPRKVDWIMGDGSDPVVCFGPGMRWRPGLASDATNCRHEYKSSSADLPGGTYGLSATVTWAFEWWLNGVPQGEFGTVEATTEFTYPVGEVQAIETG